MIVWLIATMICWLYGVEMDIAAKCVCIPFSFAESLLEVGLVFNFIIKRIKK